MGGGVGVGCLTCHAVAGKGEKLDTDFTRSNVVGSPASLLAAMWNNSRYMEAQAQRQGIVLPVLTGQDLGDLAAYLASLRKPDARRERSG